MLDGRRAGDPLRRQPRARLPLRRGRGRRLPGDRATRSARGGAARARRSTPAASARTRSREVRGADRRGRRRRTSSPNTAAPATRPGEIDRQYVDSTKLRELTGWRPEVELRDGLRRTLEWYRDQPGGCVPDVRTIHGHGQGHEEDRRPLPGRAGEGAGAERRRARRRRRRTERAEKAATALGRFNVAPTQEILTVRSSPDPEEAAQGEREARLMRWGLVPRWAKDLKVGYRMINAKAENLTTSRAYSPAGRQVPPPLPDRRRRLLRVDEGRGPEAAAPALALHRRRRRALRLRRDLHPQGVGGRRGARASRTAGSTAARSSPRRRTRWSPRSTTGCRRSCPAPRPRRPGCAPTSSVEDAMAMCAPLAGAPDGRAPRPTRS